jgi:restriction system protein
VAIPATALDADRTRLLYAVTMPIPDYQTVMLPVLSLAGDGRKHKHSAAVETLAEQFHLTPEERSALLPSGTQPVFYNRVHWARSYLKQAGLLESTGTGRFRITAAGAQVLETNPSRIDIKFLRQFPSFVQFRGTSSAKQRPIAAATEPTATNIAEMATEDETPEEVLEGAYQNLRAALAQDLLNGIAKCPPAFSERLVVELLVAMGYGGSLQDAGRVVGQSGDGGIDGIIKGTSWASTRSTCRPSVGPARSGVPW